MLVQAQGTRSGERWRATRSGPVGGLFSFTVEYPTVTHRVIRLAGEIDMLTAPDLRACILDRLDAQPQRLVLDFSAVSFFGCSGLAVLVEVKQSAENQGTELYLTGAEGAVTRLLFLTRLAPLVGDAPPPPDLQPPDRWFRHR